MRWLSGVGLLGLGVGASLAEAGHVRRAKPSYVANTDRADAVKAAFQRSWDGYYQYAFPHDSLLPVSKSYDDDRNGWGASAIDGFSTALVMELNDVIQQILDHVQTVDFNSAVGEISLFETTIRYLGGLLAAYDLIQGPLSQFNTNSTAVENILTQAQNLADNLKVAFNTTTGIPDNSLYFSPPHIAGSTSNGIATIGTLILEWTRLADLTGDTTYQELVEKAESYLLDPQPADLAEPFPGLIGTNVEISTGQFLDGSGGWIGGDDSFYEYLIKMYLYDPVRFSAYKDRWIAAADSSMTYLASHPISQPNLTFLAWYENTTLVFESEHLACFDGGNFILAGLTLDEQKYIDFGIELTAACHQTYTATATGIGPEIFEWQDSGDLVAVNASNNPAAPADWADFSETAGFWITSSAYVLRPEVIESYYYAYRATGDTKYQDWAWDAFLAINETCWAGVGYSSIDNVNTVGGGGFDDFQESFWFAEVLKYSYLIQAADSEFQVQADHSNQFVYNTECHPVKIPGGESLSK